MSTLSCAATGITEFAKAIVTNPSETCFRSHLTELSFRSAMADFRRSEDEANDEHGNKQNSLPITGADTPTLQPISPLRFANRVAISLRTPTLYYRSFFLLSIAITPPLQSPAYLSDNRQTKKNASIKERHLLWVGTWGSWTEVMLIPLYVEWVWRVVTRGAKEKSRKRTSVDKPGVFEIRSVAPKEEPVTPNRKP